MKKILILSAFINVLLFSYIGYRFIKSSAAKKVNPFAQNHFRVSDYWKAKNDQYNSLIIDSSATVLVGNSLTEMGQWSELLRMPRIHNRGISGDNSEGFAQRIEAIARSKPEVIVIDEGINDILYGVPLKDYLSYMERGVETIRQASPATQVLVFSILPTSDLSRNVLIKEWNRELQQLCSELRLEYINHYDYFTDRAGRLNPSFTIDGIHLTGEGYILWASLLKPYFQPLPESLPKHSSVTKNSNIQKY